MCLDIVVEKYDGTSEEVKTGYKWVKKHKDKLMAPSRGVEYRIDEWDEAEALKVAVYFDYLDSTDYISGFHIFETKEAALSYWASCLCEGNTLFEVQYKGLLAKGHEFTNRPVANSRVPVVVAKYMRIVGEVV